MGDGDFQPPIESTPLNRSSKTLSQVITSATPTALPNLVHICPWGASGRMGQYNLNYFYLYPFLGTRLQVRRIDGFSRIMAQTTRTRVFR